MLPNMRKISTRSEIAELSGELELFVAVVSFDHFSTLCGIFSH